jgi:crotonobetainyl-CoA:carnitine CoA-transferase CaiB-like acyl-CoA transferase
MTVSSDALSAVTPVAELARRSVDAVGLAASDLLGLEPLAPDPERIAIAYTSERHFQFDGAKATAFAPLSGFFRTRDGWVRTHGNYPHHARALRAAMQIADDDALPAALSRMTAAEAVSAATRADALCVAVRVEAPAIDAALCAAPLVSVRRTAEAAARALPAVSALSPLHGIRVLDLTRVIAGPVCTRTLALLGADVLRIDPRARAEIEWQHLDTGHGKRSARLDLRADGERATFDELVRGADIVVLGYRPAGLARLGITPASLSVMRPDLITLQLSAWGTDDERGFDSLVQASSGIAMVESADGETPGALPAQALDHSAGYLLAAAALRLLTRRAEEGGGWLARTSLRRIAAELLSGRRTMDAALRLRSPDPAPHVQTHIVDGHEVTTTRPAVMWAGGGDVFAAPRRWGQDEPVWLEG